MTPEYTISATPEHTISALCQRSHEISKEKGWVGETDDRPFSAVTSLFHSELSEAYEDYRNNKELNETWYEWNGQTFTKAEVAKHKEFEGVLLKPCGIPTELADFIIRICQWIGTNKQTEAFADAFSNIRSNIRSPLYQNFDDFCANAHGLVSLAYRVLGMRIGVLGSVAANTFAFCKDYGIDLWAAIDEKEAYNRTRSFRHGGKKV